MSDLANRIAQDLIDRTELIYERVERRFNIRRVDELRLDWIFPTPTPCSVQPLRTDAFTNPADAMQEVAGLFREALLADADVQFEVWVEKQALDDCVPRIAALYACRGFATVAFIHDWADWIDCSDAYQACGAADDIAETLARLADDRILAQRVAVMPELIAVWPTHLHQYLFPPDQRNDLCQTVRQAMEDYVPNEKLKILELARENDFEVSLRWDPWKWRPG